MICDLFECQKKLKQTKKKSKPKNTKKKEIRKGNTKKKKHTKLKQKGGITVKGSGGSVCNFVEYHDDSNESNLSENSLSDDNVDVLKTKINKYHTSNNFK